MFGWRRRTEGFEWREYVRTTVLVRRADRQRRIDEARLAAIEKVKHAAEAGADAGRAGVSLAGSQLLKLLSMIGVALLDVAIAAFYATGRWLGFFGAVLRDALGGLGKPLSGAARVPLDAVRQPLEAAREKMQGVLRDRLQAMPDVARHVSIKSPVKLRHVLWAGAVLGLIFIGGPILRSADGLSVATLEEPAERAVTVASEIAGRAVAITGDTMRVDGTLVRLDGIEAPAARQPCYRANGRRWSCASASRSALDRLVRGRAVACESSGKTQAGYVVARCAVDGGSDVAGELVRDGYAFAANSFFNSLTGDEETARNAKAGIWQGEIARPEQWREQVWQDAKREAPEGCPIKGLIRASEKLYALPWSEDYARVKVRSERGERWFCSEDEAKAAGFLPSSRS